MSNIQKFSIFILLAILVGYSASWFYFSNQGKKHLANNFQIKEQDISARGFPFKLEYFFTQDSDQTEGNILLPTIYFAGLKIWLPSSIELNPFSSFVSFHYAEKGMIIDDIQNIKITFHSDNSKAYFALANFILKDIKTEDQNNLNEKETLFLINNIDRISVSGDMLENKLIKPINLELSIKDKKEYQSLTEIMRDVPKNVKLSINLKSVEKNNILETLSNIDNFDNFISSINFYPVDGDFIIDLHFPKDRAVSPNLFIPFDSLKGTILNYNAKWTDIIAHSLLEGAFKIEEDNMTFSMKTSGDFNKENPDYMKAILENKNLDKILKEYLSVYKLIASDSQFRDINFAVLEEFLLDYIKNTNHEKLSSLIKSSSPYEIMFDFLVSEDFGFEKGFPFELKIKVADERKLNIENGIFKDGILNFKLLADEKSINTLASLILSDELIFLLTDNHENSKEIKNLLNNFTKFAENYAEQMKPLFELDNEKKLYNGDIELDLYDINSSKINGKFIPSIIELLSKN